MRGVKEARGAWHPHGRKADVEAEAEVQVEDRVGLPMPPSSPARETIGLLRPPAPGPRIGAPAPCLRLLKPEAKLKRKLSALERP